MQGSRLEAFRFRDKDLALRGQKFFASSREGDSSRCGGLQVAVLLVKFHAA